MTLKDVKWRLVYDILALQFKGKEFRFEDALEYITSIGKDMGITNLKYASKLLNEIEDNAHAVHRRADDDQRFRLYRLLSSEKVSTARGVYQKVLLTKQDGFELIDFVSEANKSAGWDYGYIKESAVGFWTNYHRSVDVYHLSVSKEDADGWIALCRLWDGQIVIDGKVVYESTAKPQTVHLHSDMDVRMGQFDKNHYQRPYYTIIECFKDNDFQGGLAVLILQKENLNWKELIKHASSSGLINTLGFSMDFVNKVSERIFFDKNTISKIEENKSSSFETIEGVKGETWADLVIADLENKWNVKCYQSHILRKTVEDLIR
ncbi:MAG: hypothetical protein WC974_02350 [Thermoplasmata archaeon]